MTGSKAEIYAAAIPGEFVLSRMNYLAASREVSKFTKELCLRGVTRECFYRGSSPNFTWVPA